MKTKQVVQKSANVVPITSILPGDLYKRFEDSGGYTYFGIVDEIHGDGENIIVKSTEYDCSWGSLNVSNKIIRGTKDSVIFTSTPEEFNLELSKVKEKKLEEIEDAKSKIEKNKKLIEEIDGLMIVETDELQRIVSRAI